MIGSVALMLDKSFGMKAEATKIMDAMRTVFGQGVTTADLRDPEGGDEPVSTTEFTNRVIAALAG